MANPDVSYRLKTIKFLGRSVPIVLQNENGPCPLLAIANVLLLRNAVQLPTSAHEVSEVKLVEAVADWLIDANSQDRIGSRAKDPEYMASLERNIHDAMQLLPKLCTGVDVNVQFHDIKGFEFTDEVAIFDLLDISLVHGWLVDPQDPAAGLIGQKSYNEIATQLVTLLGEENPKRLLTPLNSRSFRSSGSGPTPQETLQPGLSQGAANSQQSAEGLFSGDVGGAYGGSSTPLRADNFGGPPTPVGPVEYEVQLKEQSGEGGGATEGAKRDMAAWDYAEEMHLTDETYEELRAALHLSVSQPEPGSTPNTEPASTDRPLTGAPEQPMDIQPEVVTPLKGSSGTGVGLPEQVKRDSLGNGGFSDRSVDVETPGQAAVEAGHGAGDTEMQEVKADPPSPVSTSGLPAPFDYDTLMSVSTPRHLPEPTCHSPSGDKAGAHSNRPGGVELDTTMEAEPPEPVELPVSHPPPAQRVTGDGPPSPPSDEDPDLQAALRASMLDAAPSSPPAPKAVHGRARPDEEEDADLQAALRQSAAEASSRSGGVQLSKSEEDMQKALRLSMSPQAATRAEARTEWPPGDDDPDLEAALRASMQDITPPAAPPPPAQAVGLSDEDDEIRRAMELSLLDTPHPTAGVDPTEGIPGRTETPTQAVQPVSGPAWGKEIFQRTVQFTMPEAAQESALNAVSGRASGEDTPMQAAQDVYPMNGPAGGWGAAADQQRKDPFSDLDPLGVSEEPYLLSSSSDGDSDTRMSPPCEARATDLAGLRAMLAASPNAKLPEEKQPAGMPGPGGAPARESDAEVIASNAPYGAQILELRASPLSGVLPARLDSPSDRTPDFACAFPASATQGTGVDAPGVEIPASGVEIPPSPRQGVAEAAVDVQEMQDGPPPEGPVTGVIGQIEAASDIANMPPHPGFPSLKAIEQGNGFWAELERVTASAAYGTGTPKHVVDDDTEMPQATTDASAQDVVKHALDEDTEMPQASTVAVGDDHAGLGDEIRKEPGFAAPSGGLLAATDGPEETDGVVLGEKEGRRIAKADLAGDQAGLAYASGASPPTGNPAEARESSADQAGGDPSDEGDVTRRIVRELVRGAIHRILARSEEEQSGTLALTRPTDIAEEASSNEGTVPNQRVDQQKRKRDVEDALQVKEFFNNSASQLTEHGLVSLHQGLRQNELAVFFRNNHFNAIFAHDGRLLVLVTDQGYVDVQGVVWECLDNVHGNTQYCKDDFAPYTGEEPRAAPKVPADTDRGVLYCSPPSEPLTEAQKAARFLEQALALGMPQAPVDRDRELALQLQEEDARQQGHIVMPHRPPPWTNDAAFARQVANLPPDQGAAGQAPYGPYRPGAPIGPRSGMRPGPGRGRRGGRGGRDGGRGDCSIM